jgi:DNA-directed RNA polymerase specialized sigma subunit
MSDVNELLDSARQSITTTQMKHEYDVLFKALKEASNELQNIKSLEKTWIDTRNKIISRLYYKHNVSMIKLASVCGITRQMVHYICTDKKEVNNAKV